MSIFAVDHRYQRIRTASPAIDFSYEASTLVTQNLFTI